MAVSIIVAACSTPSDKDHAQFSPVSYDDLPGWQRDHAAEIIPVVANYCPKLTQQAPAWQAFCTILTQTPPHDDNAARQLIETYLQPFEVSGDNGNQGLFTGYYQAGLRGDWHRHDAYQTPIYARPDDLVTADLGLFKPEWKGQHLTGYVKSGQLKPYDDRAMIDGGSLEGRAKPLLWVDDPVDAFVMAIQGSGLVHMADGQTIALGYDSANGQSYVAIGRWLLDHGELDKPVSMPKIRAWLAAHPDRAAAVMETNPSYVFFQRRDRAAAIGAAGHALTPLRSLAVDPAYIPYGALLWLDTKDGTGTPLQRLIVAEDTGGAIKGVVRGDVFWGFGADAEAQSGVMQSQGRYFIFQIKTVH